MKRLMLSGKIHRATVTTVDLNYEGSVTIDQDLMDAAGMVAYEQVHIFDINNGNRLITYVVPAERGSGEIGINGAAAKLVKKGDLVIIVSFIMLDDVKTKGYKPRIVFVDKKNAFKEM
jgi:aspartate 1-decarboxylase